MPALGVFTDQAGKVVKPTYPDEHGVWDFDEDDYLLYALLCDPVYCAELLGDDPGNRAYGGMFVVRDYQYPLFRTQANYAGFTCARSVGKTESVKWRAICHTFKRLGENLLITAPELIHLLPLTDAIEGIVRRVRLTREFLARDGQKTGFTHRPFGVDYADGTKIVGRIPRLTGTGVKGQHQPDLIVDEGQDYPEKGWVEVHETVLKDHVDADGNPDFTYHFFGVHSGSRDSGFHKRSAKGGFKIIQITALQRPGWSAEEKAAAKGAYGGTDASDYRRNILGEPGSAASAYFVTSRLVACFLPTTLISTKYGRRPIGEIRPGDMVLNANGEGAVEAVRRVRRSAVALVRMEDGEEIVCSPEHPFFTGDVGWCHADRLRPGFELIGHGEAVRGMRGDAEDQADEILFAQLRREVAGEDGGRAGLPGAHLSELRRAFHEVGSREVLWSCLHGGLRGRSAPWSTARCQVMRLLRAGVHTQEADEQVLRARVPGEDERGPQLGDARHFETVISEQSGDGRLAGPAVCALAVPRGMGGGLVPGAVDEPPGCGAGRGELHDRHRASGDADCRRGGWSESPDRCQDGQTRPPAGPVVARRRVASVAILKPGDRDWNRRCGSGDSVDLVDLTISGHPSFCVGRHGLLVHNCMDQDRESDYNVHGYRHQQIRVEDYEEDGLPIADVLDLPAGLKNVWGGMDIGLTHSPTVITLWTLVKVNRVPRLKLVRRIHLERMRTRTLREALYAIGWFYGTELKGFGMDITGLGFPIWQEMEDDEETEAIQTERGRVARPAIMRPAHDGGVARGYFFNAATPVNVDKAQVSTDAKGRMRDMLGAQVTEERDPNTGGVRYVTKMPMIEASTRYLREMVDTTHLLLPFDPEIISDMQMETQQRVNRVAGLKNKPNAMHILDSMRAMAMSYRAEDVEAQLAYDGQRAVLDMAL